MTDWNPRGHDIVEGVRYSNTQSGSVVRGQFGELHVYLLVEMHADMSRVKVQAVDETMYLNSSRMQS